MIDKNITIEQLRRLVAREYELNNSNQRKFWYDTMKKLEGTRVFVMYMNPRSVARSCVLTITKAYKHFAVGEQKIYDCEGNPRRPITYSIHYNSLIGKSVYIEILEE